MSVTFEKLGPVLVVDLLGRLDSANSPQIEGELLERITGADGAVLLDLARLDYISSAGLRVVLVIAKRMKQAGRALVLCSLQPNIHDVFEISGFLSILDVVPKRADALAKLK
ncbi:anti-sigma factor antagonist [Kaistia algarum]|uniref:STAS domain-containing protein n=1 Tax=Kaistia algarum TaxID=2083279 RepID=UPI000CE85F76|nr:STAS domain-containing protein [Kaistia algarum]MCX5515847.1 STAS domain-containing protein [Kaistia algarum]PPE80785.1 anti-sigma factor antagonist [Kaistia algarum]